jgi:5,10-methylenetetrahydromethanopterin reductase
MALTAERTTVPMIGPVVSVPVTRHPSVAANSIATLQKLSGGRAFYGLGPGDFALHQIGEVPVRLHELAEWASVVRTLCAGERATWQGKDIQLRWTAGPVPLWMAGDGPRMLELAGRLGDGVICGNAATPEQAVWALDHIGQGAAEAGRSVDELDVWFIVRIHVAASSAEGIRDLGAYLARAPKNRFRVKMREKGIPIDDDLEARILAYNREFDYRDAYRTESSGNFELLGKHGLTDWAAEQFLVTGTLDEVVARLVGLVDAGVRNFLVPQMLPERIMTTSSAAAQAIDALRRTLRQQQESRAPAR